MLANRHGRAGRQDRIGVLGKVAVMVGAGVVAASLAAFAAGPGAAAATAPNAQSAGNFLDATAGGKPIDQVLALAFARAQNPGSVTDQNPLDVTALNTINLPLTGKLQFPQLLGIGLGAVNQVANAQSTGRSWGGAGAVDNSGGISIGGQNNAFPANATIDLSASGVTGNKVTNTLNALGGVTVSVGAVTGTAQTPAGKGKAGSTGYEIAGLTIDAASPLIASILHPIDAAISTLLTTLAKSFGTSGCPTSLPALKIENGAITLDPSTGGLSISLDKLLNVLGLNINNLPPNTDVIDALLTYLSSPTGLAKGIADAITGLDVLQQFTDCAPAQFKALVTGLLKLTGGLQDVIDTVLGKLGTVTSGKSPLGPLSTVLKNLVDVGINVQPNGAAGTFTSKLGALPKQGMTPPPVPYQYVERAIEVDVLGTTLDLALGNAAAGPSNPAVTPTPTPTTSVPPTSIPTGVPAGAGQTTSDLPLVLLVGGVFLAAGGAAAATVRVRRK